MLMSHSRSSKFRFKQEEDKQHINRTVYDGLISHGSYNSIEFSQ